jgi:hypothetical protein
VQKGTALLQPDGDLGGLGVLGDVGERLLHRPEQGQRHRFWQAGLLVTGQLQLAAGLPAQREVLGQPLDGRHQAHVQGPGPQVRGHVPHHIGHRRHGLAHALGPLQGLRVGQQALAQHRQVHAQGRDQLTELVVHLAGDALALVLDQLAFVDHQRAQLLARVPQGILDALALGHVLQGAHQHLAAAAALHHRVQVHHHHLAVGAHQPGVDAQTAIALQSPLQGRGIGRPVLLRHALDPTPARQHLVRRPVAQQAQQLHGAGHGPALHIQLPFAHAGHALGRGQPQACCGDLLVGPPAGLHVGGLHQQAHLFVAFPGRRLSTRDVHAGSAAGRRTACSPMCMPRSPARWPRAPRAP